MTIFDTIRSEVERLTDETMGEAVDPQVELERELTRLTNDGQPARVRIRTPYPEGTGPPNYALGFWKELGDVTYDPDDFATVGNTGVVIDWPDVYAYHLQEHDGWYLIQLDDGRGYVPAHLSMFEIAK